MNDMDWDAFRVLLAVVEAGSFSAGARALRISQPTAGRKVAALEEALGIRLFVRRPRGAVLTPAGEEVVAEARRMAEGADAALRRASGTDRRTIVRLSASEGIGASWLPHHLLGIARLHPELRLELVVENTPDSLSRRQADVAVSVFRPSDADIVTRKVARLGFGLFAAPAYLAARGTPRSPQDLSNHDLIGAPQEAAVAPYEHWLRTYVPAERFVVRSASLLAQHEAARAGFGVVLGSVAVLGEDAALRRVVPRARPPALNVWISVHADLRRTPSVSKVFDALLELFAREAGSLRDETRRASEGKRRRGA